MKFNQDLFRTCSSGNQNSTFGSVVPLAMFSSFSFNLYEIVAPCLKLFFGQPIHSKCKPTVFFCDVYSHFASIGKDCACLFIFPYGKYG